MFDNSRRLYNDYLMYKGSCLCGDVHWEFTGVIESVTACNCTACRRFGTLWAYGHENEEIKVLGKTSHYARKVDGTLEFHFCGRCSCVVSWRSKSLNKEGQRRIAVNVRLIDDPNKIADLPIDHFDGFDTFEDLPRDHRCIKDMWF